MMKRIALYLSCTIVIGLTAACGFLPPLSPEKTERPVTTKPAKTKDGDSSSAVPIPAPVVVPPGYDERPASAQGSSGGLRALQPLKGVNTDTLFSENLKDPEARFERLENAVLDLRREFETMKPSIVRLVAVESDIQELMGQLEVLLREEPMASAAPSPAQNNHYTAQGAPSSRATAPPESLNPQPQKQAAAKPAAHKPPPASQMQTDQAEGSSMVKSFRIGRHSGKTRVVLDLSTGGPYTLDLDNRENLLIVELPSSSWQSAMERTYGRGLVKSYSVQPINDGKGSRLIVYLGKATQILEDKAIKPGVSPHHRIFIDLKS
jgi:hypothetical protein